MRSNLLFNGLAVSLMCLLTAGCIVQDPLGLEGTMGAEDIAESTLAGTINGESWSFVSGWGKGGWLNSS